MDDVIRERCGTCRWWHQGAPMLATATQSPDHKLHLGTCEVEPPTVFIHVGVPFTFFPQTAEGRGCGAWEAVDDEGDGGGGEEAPVIEPVPGGEVVVSIQRRAA